jgi:acyl-CoA thioesterase-1
MKKFLLLFIGVIFLGACSNQTPAVLPFISHDGIILAVGDSLTYGSGAGGKENSYPAVLEKLIDRKVINAGVPGLMTKGALQRLPKLIQQYKPDLVLLCIGGNDFLKRVHKETVEHNIATMINMLQLKNIPVVLIATPKPGLTITPPELYEQIAKTYNIPIEQNLLAKLERKGEYKSDSVHLNALGYKTLAEGIAQTLKQYGAIE